MATQMIEPMVTVRRIDIRFALRYASRQFRQGLIDPGELCRACQQASLAQDLFLIGQDFTLVRDDFLWPRSLS